MQPPAGFVNKMSLIYPWPSTVYVPSVGVIVLNVCHRDRMAYKRLKYL